MKNHESFKRRQEHGRAVAAAVTAALAAGTLDSAVYRQRQAISAMFREDQRAEDARAIREGREPYTWARLLDGDPHALAPTRRDVERLADDQGPMDARRRMLRDIMVTAFEGGCNYWAEARRVVRDTDEASPRHLDYLSFELRSAEDADDARLGRWVRVDERAIARGMERILSAPQDIGEHGESKLRVRRDILGAIALANVNPEDADIDAEAADCIVQAAMWGEIVYG